jgi:hypothetical protein
MLRQVGVSGWVGCGDEGGQSGGSALRARPAVVADGGAAPRQLADPVDEHGSVGISPPIVVDLVDSDDVPDRFACTRTKAPLISEIFQVA